MTPKGQEPETGSVNMSDAHQYRYAPVLVIGVIAIAVASVMFSEAHRSTPAKEQDRPR